MASAACWNPPWPTFHFMCISCPR